MPRSSRKPRHLQLQLDLHFELLVEVERREEPEKVFEVCAKTFLSDYSIRGKDPFWAAVINEDFL